jgi:hypothetical protein
VELLPTYPSGGDQVGLLEHLEVLHVAEARHRQPLVERRERLPVLLEETVEQRTSRGIRKRLEHRFHGAGL